MSSTDGSLIASVQNSQEAPNCKKNVVVDDVSITDQQNEEILRCFVCDVRVHGRRYALATCKTQSSRARVIEKLGELVGERYVVVISEDDVICRNCASLINTLDRLESEMKDVRSAVLRFLERKYSLAEGELLNCSEVSRHGQPPQITRSDTNGQDYHSRKRGAINIDNGNCPSKRMKKSNVWMQCDKCRYTTLSNTYMIYHIRQHTKKKVYCDKCGVEIPGRKPSLHRCKEFGNENNSGETDYLEEESRAIQTAPLETVDLAATGEEMDEDTSTMPAMTLQSNLDSVTSKDDQIQLISLPNPNAVQFQNFLNNDGTLKDGQPLFMRVLQQFGVGEDVGQGALTMPALNSDMIVAKENTAKQMLTLVEDGSLEMVAVDYWNDDNPPDCNTEMTF